MSSVMDILGPLFALVVAGQVLYRLHWLGDGFWPGAERLNYFILFPALLFNSLAHAPFSNPQLPTVASAVLLTLLLGWLGLLWGRRLYHWPARRFGALTQGILRFNTYLGLAIIGGLFKTEGLALAAIVLACLVPVANLLSVWALTAEHGWTNSALISIVKNPLILACVAGGLLNLSGLTMGQGIERLLSLLASASLPLGLLCVGAAIRLQDLSGEGVTLFWNTVLRLAFMPILALGVALGLGLAPLASAVLVIFFALPTAPTAYTLTHQLGGDGALMARLITLQTLLAAFTLPFVLHFLV